MTAWGLPVLDAAAARASRDLPADQALAAVRALDELRPVAPLMEAASREEFSRVVVALDLGDVSLARSLWLRDVASEAVRWAALGESVVEAEAAAAQREAEWGAFWSAVGKAAGHLASYGLGLAWRLLLAALVAA